MNGYPLPKSFSVGGYKSLNLTTLGALRQTCADIQNVGVREEAQKIIVQQEMGHLFTNLLTEQEKRDPNLFGPSLGYYTTIWEKDLKAAVVAKDWQTAFLYTGLLHIAQDGQNKSKIELDGIK